MLHQEEKKKKKIAGFALILRWERQRRPKGKTDQNAEKQLRKQEPR